MTSVVRHVVRVLVIKAGNKHLSYSANSEVKVSVKQRILQMEAGEQMNQSASSSQAAAHVTLRQHVTNSNSSSSSSGSGSSKPQKQRPNNKAFELFERRGIIIGPVSV